VRLRPALLAPLLLAALAPPCFASGAVDTLLLQARTTPELRALLADHAETARDSLQRGEAFYYLGMSYEREGRRDSAIAYYQEAVALRNDDLERRALMDALLRRRGSGDAERVLRVLARRPHDVIGEPVRDVSEWNGRRGWALYEMGLGDSALKLLRASQYFLVQPINPMQREWRYRMGVVEEDHGDVQRAVETLGLLAVEARFKDKELMTDLGDALKRVGSNAGNFELAMKQQRTEMDLADKAALDALGARRVMFKGLDGAQLSGIVFAKKGPRPARAVVALTPPDTPVESFDSLAVGLRRAGYAMILVDVRGGGFSVDENAPLPESWHDREAEMEAKVARDVGPALRALAKAATVDTTRYLLVGIGRTAPIAVEAASGDPRARALMLISPDAAPTDRGIVRARLAKLGRPVFFQVPSFDVGTMPFVEALYESTNQRISRISDSELAGYGAQSFHYDASALPRLMRWLNESWTAQGAKPSPRR
jgi:tetratricopeptide (TPR) repeat protein